MTDEITLQLRTGEPDGLERRATWLDPNAEKSRDLEDDEVPLPANVAEDLGLTHGQSIRVTQRPLTHRDDAALLRHAVVDDQIDPVRLLQGIIDRTVTSSNIRIHPLTPEEAEEKPRNTMNRLASANLFWFLYAWLGAADVNRRVTTSGSELDRFKKKSR